MAVQPETIKFGPQWIRELSDGAFISRRHSSQSPTKDRSTGRTQNTSVQKYSSVSADTVVLTSNNRQGDLVPDQFECSLWNEDEVPTVNPLLKMNKSHAMGSSQPPGDSQNEYVTSLSTSKADYDSKYNANIGNEFSKTCDNIQDVHISWHHKTSVDIIPEYSWQTHPRAVDSIATSKSQTTDVGKGGMNLSASSKTQPSSTNTSYISKPVASCRSNFENSSLDPVSNQSDYNLESNNPPHSRCSGTGAIGGDINQSKRAVSAYYGVQNPDRQFVDSNAISSSIWMQQHIWSKSVPQHLHGLNPTESVSTTIPNLFNTVSTLTNRQTSSSVPDSDNMEDVFSHFSAYDRSIQPDPTISHNSLSLRPPTFQGSFNALDEERGLHRPDGADQPDEHMWLYEDPQGRTQGSFSDAQMHEWLLAGIYFTPNLRIRRKCDDTFSSLANYTQLFNRVPFAPGPRVPPIRGGITSTMISVAKSEALCQSHLNGNDNSISNDRLGSEILSSTPSAHATSDVNALNSSMFLGSSSVDPTRSSLPESQRSVYQHHSEHLEFQSSVPSATVHGSILPGSADTEHLPKSTHMNAVHRNNNLSASQNHLYTPVSLLTNAVGSLGANSTTENEFESNLDNSLQTYLQRQVPVTSVSNFMNLASLLSVNPGLASLAISLPSRCNTNGNESPGADLSNILSPGFISALTQYLDVQPTSTGMQSVSPMQQLAETAQLAAQLAALVGAHSPDQTPMQPTQALALAQFLMTRGVSLGRKDNSGENISSTSNVVTNACRKEENFSTDNSSNVSGTSHTMGSNAVSGNERRQDLKSHWPALGISTNRVSPRNNDAHLNALPLNKCSNESSNFGQINGASVLNGQTNFGQHVYNYRSNHTSKAQSTTTKHTGSPRSSNNVSNSNIKSKTPSDLSGIDINNPNTSYDNYTRNWTTNRNSYTGIDGISNSSESRLNHPNSGTSSKSILSNQWTNKAKQSIANTNVTSNHGSTLLQGADFKNSLHDTTTTATITTFITPGAVNATVGHTNAVNHKGSKSSANVRSPVKNSTSAKSGSSAVKVIATTANATTTNTNTGTNSSSKITTTTVTTTGDANTKLGSPESSQTSNALNKNAESDRAVEEELDKLIQWCQSRLSSLPMREKVDIPTVVELLATLDAPYEVERMVQTFLGETTRTAQFVKDFLDHRRPFWQLHRERREQASLSQQQQKASQSNQNSNAPKSTDKKKRTSGLDNGSNNLQRQNPSVSNGLSWTKSDTSHLSASEQFQDNQWHHIRSKGSHNRKSKKDKSS